MQDELTQQVYQAFQKVALDPSDILQIGKDLCKLIFKDDDGKPFELTDGQAEIFMAILCKWHNRVQVITYTQYGKSETVAMAVDLRSIVFKENWTIVAGEQDKADIIMGKAIKHLFDHPALEEQIDPSNIEKLEKLKYQKSRDRITWRDGGELKTLTASAENRKKVKKAVTGHGARNLIEDEASLIPDDLQAMIMRMLGGFKDSFLIKIGNPFFRNHFMKTWNSDKYHKIFIDYKQGLREGRITQSFIDEMRDLPFFDILYECRFPENDEILTGGYRRLVTDEMLEAAFITEAEFEQMCDREIYSEDGTLIRKVPSGQPRLGADFAGGGSDRTAYVVRWPNVMKLISTNKNADTMSQVPIVQDIAREWGVEDRDIAIDYGGVGQGVGDRLHELDILVLQIMFGQSAPPLEKHKYKNMRAYMYYEMSSWFKKGGKIVKDDGFYEFLVVNYKVDSEKKMQIQPKEDLKKLMRHLGLQVTSPDIPDAAVLTFADNSELINEEDYDFV